VSKYTGCAHMQEELQMRDSGYAQANVEVTRVLGAVWSSAACGCLLFVARCSLAATRAALKLRRHPYDPRTTLVRLTWYGRTTYFMTGTLDTAALATPQGASSDMTAGVST
jgi:hypothetical protein